MLFLELKSVRGRGISSKFPTDLTEAMERRIMRRGKDIRENFPFRH